MALVAAAYQGEEVGDAFYSDAFNTRTIRKGLTHKLTPVVVDLVTYLGLVRTPAVELTLWRQT